MASEARFKKGEKLFSEGESIKNVFVIQSGRVAIYIERAGQRIELDEVSTSNIVGDQGIFFNPKMNFTAEALSEVRALEVPIEILKQQADKSPAALKILTRSMADEAKRLRLQMRSVKMEQDSSPCPQKFIPRIFSTIALVTHHGGTHEKFPDNMPDYKKEEFLKSQPENFSEEDLIVPWTKMKIYANRMFLESIVRMGHALELLHKLKHITLSWEVDEESGVKEMTNIRVHNLEIIETFSEFFQHNLFKPGKAEVIYIDKLAYQLAGSLVEMSKDIETDRLGVVRLEYQPLLDDVKKNFGFKIKDTHLNSMEKKGLFVKRTTVDEKVYVAFDKVEFETTFAYWQIINEIDKWNSRGFVDMDEDISLYVDEGDASACPECKAQLVPEAKFCAQCGHKVEEAA